MRKIEYHQRSRQKGATTPPNTRYVGRGSRWGNHLKIGEMSRAQVIKGYIDWLEAELKNKPETITEWLRPLAQADYLSCWCKPNEPCHAKVLIEVVHALWSGTPAEGTAISVLERMRNELPR